ncbi:testis-specific gene A8 protein-like isoform X2 [Daphnia pulex]|uniref:testis-specific gene A8 protein-like isoform X2 n=1 Tax=Daphnia pulex TaxID=6669 RepID=UPI001EDE34AE|nr:testis-specific gene A8 protein-like isoform X2 [Daphnia pulex]
MKCFLFFVLVLGVLTSSIKGSTTEGKATHHEAENGAKKLDDVTSAVKSAANSTKTESVILATIVPVRKEREVTAAPHTTPKAVTRKSREASAAPHTTPKAVTRKSREASAAPHTTPKAVTRKSREATAAPHTTPKAVTRKSREATAAPHATTAKTTVKH